MNLEFIPEDIERLLVSALLGAIIGVEREWRGKAAGFRTLMLVSMGSALFTIVSYKMGALNTTGTYDVTRIASNVVTGIGFLCAGLIFKGVDGVRNLTTSATVWAAAGIGMAVGIGEYTTAFVSTVVVWIILYLLHHIIDAIGKSRETKEYHATWYVSDAADIKKSQFFTHPKCKVLEEKKLKEDNKITFVWNVRAPEEKHQDIVDHILKDAKLLGLKY